jgi:heme-degrading monooxygenase HmoA
MLVKWIRCRVTDRGRFEAGQRSWAGLQRLPGFQTQAGGWSTRDPAVAHVFGCWQDQAAYDAFMTGDHDRLAGDQVGAYSGLEVRLYEHRLDIGAPLAPSLAEAAVVRLAHCHVHDDRVERFAKSQAEVWNPGMGTASGLLGGSFGQRDDTEFLVLSAWRTEAAHERYVAERCPRLRERAGAVRDLKVITGDLIRLDPAWTVRTVAAGAAR